MLADFPTFTDPSDPTFAYLAMESNGDPASAAGRHPATWSKTM